MSHHETDTQFLYRPDALPVAQPTNYNDRTYLVNVIIILVMTVTLL